MLGNVNEWCLDLYSPYPTGGCDDRLDPSGDALLVKDDRVRNIRGGTFANQPGDLRSAYRIKLQPQDRYVYNGFRPARTLP